MVLFAAFFAAVAIVIVSWYQMKYYRRNQHLKKIPSMKRYPIIGSSLDFIGKPAEQIFENLEKAFKELGPLWRLDFSLIQTQIFVSDPKIIEGVLSSQKFLTKASEYDVLRAWLGDGLLLSTNEKWHQRRKIITPSFHFKILEHFTGILDAQGQVFVSVLKKLATESDQFDLFPLISLYALDVICESAMGTKINAQVDSNSEYVKAVKEITNVAHLRMFDLSKKIKFTYQFSELYQHELRVLKILHKFTNSVILSRQQALLENTGTKNTSEKDDFGSKKKTALLDLLLQSTVNGQPLSNGDIREEVNTFMFEGHDTATSGIAFVLYNLAKYPEIQKKVLDESLAVLGTDHDKPITMRELNDLNYLELVIKESLRLYPSVPLFGRHMFADLKIGDVTLPKKPTVIIAPYFLGRNAEVFPDPLKFDPERFNVVTDNEKNNPYGYVPFSAGPRNCIGQKFAMLEMKSVVSKVIRNFELTLSKEHEELVLISEIVLRPVNGIVLGIKQRALSPYFSPHKQT